MTKRIKWGAPLVWIVIALVSFVSELVIPYLEGRSNSLWMIPPMLPAVALSHVLLMVSCVALLWCWIRSIKSKQDSAVVGVMFSLSVVLFGASIMLRPSFLFQRGFCHYAKTVLTANEWRSLSRAAQERLRPEGRLPGPRKNLWEEKEHRALWSYLCGATAIQRLDPSLMIFVSPERTDIVWGGALVGHRCVVIFNRGHKAEVVGRSLHTIFIADDIATVVGPD